MLRSYLFVALCLVGINWPMESFADSIRVYVGTYTSGESEGIYTFELDAETAKPTQPQLAAKLKNPSFVAISPDQKFLYAAGESEVSGVTAFAIDSQSGQLNLLNSQSSGGAGPCHLSVDHTGKCVIVANYGGGSVACLPIAEDGSLQQASTFIQHTGSSINPSRQKGPHAHSANIDQNNNFAVVADLGLDQLLVYKLDASKGVLTPHDPPFTNVDPGNGPRHFSFHPNGKFAYNCNEMTSSITAHAYDAKAGTLTPLMSQSTLPTDFTGNNNSTAECLVHPSGKFVYVSNRGHNSIAAFQIKADGTVQASGHTSTNGEIPRNFGITPDGKFLLAANQNSAKIVIFKIDQNTGNLIPTGDVVSVPNPVCVRFLQPA